MIYSCHEQWRSRGLRKGAPAKSIALKGPFFNACMLTLGYFSSFAELDQNRKRISMISLTLNLVQNGRIGIKLTPNLAPKDWMIGVFHNLWQVYITLSPCEGWFENGKTISPHLTPLKMVPGAFSKNASSHWNIAWKHQ